MEATRCQRQHCDSCNLRRDRNFLTCYFVVILVLPRRVREQGRRIRRREKWSMTRSVVLFGKKFGGGNEAKSVFCTLGARRSDVLQASEYAPVGIYFAKLPAAIGLDSRTMSAGSWSEFRILNRLQRQNWFIDFH